MVNYPQQSPKQSGTAFLCLVLMFWTPHIGLEYVFEAENGGKIQLPYGQYLFFFSSFFAGVCLIYSLRISNLVAIFSKKTLWTAVTFLFIGVVLSSTSLWGWRLFAIIGTISALSVVAANFVLYCPVKTQNLALIFLVIPFSVPVFGSVLLEFFGPIDSGVFLTNAKHMSYSPPRWHFLHKYANGFGYDAALVSVFLLISIFYTNRLIFRVAALILLCVAVYALVMSGTRAALIFFITAIFSFFLLTRRIKYILIGSGSIVLILAFTFSLESLTNWLRLSSDIETFSSHRWSGILGMWNIFKSSPFLGLGFGSADGYFTSYGRFPVDTSNVFYLGLLAEIGFFGFLGALMIIAYPSKHIISCLFEQGGLCDAPLLLIFSASVLAGFVPYLMFEFDVLRVSVNNQLFFFCWGVLVFYFTNLNTSSRHKSGT